jgi:uncharacterized protein
MTKMKFYDWIAFVLLVIGGLNWGLTVFNFNLVSFLLGAGLLSKIVYSLVGIAGLFGIITIFKLAGKK